MFSISALLDVQANLPETSPFFVYHNGFGEHLFSIFIELHGMHNFAKMLDNEDHHHKKGVDIYDERGVLTLRSTEKAAK